ncbi:MAG: aminoacyl-tRNA hydrolase [Clostridia bacterium]|nr:aminoacyl-tRNA hydrolase [Clostridia bacterium]MBQ9919441.1 aminoacyl-tRNA hydrolase [Clostridia bacterium]
MFSRFKKGPTGSFDYLIVGLGNPGLQYEKTRHNVGFRAVDKLCDELGTKCDRSKFKSLYTDAKIGDKRVLILKPQTYMNNSGQAVTEAMSFYKIPIGKVIVISDDVTLDVGRLRIRAKGSAGGHKGLKDIIELSGSEEFPRIKIGCGKKPHPDYDIKDWVLGKFPKQEEKAIEEVISLAADAAICMVKTDIQTAMNRYNR